MRKGLQNLQTEEEKANAQYKILAVDDEEGIIDSLSIFLKRSGYNFTGVTDPLEAIEKVKTEHFDMLILDFIMTPLHGDQVVEEIRKFNKELYILLLTGHKDLAPPLETIKRLDIQGYCEKSDKFDQLLLLIESGIKSIEQMKTIRQINEELHDKNDELEKAYLDTIGILRQTVEAKDPYTRGHSDRVAEYSVLIGKHLGLSDADLKTLQIGGLFHDIGKIGVDEKILNKPGKLTKEEFEIMKTHTVIGAEMLEQLLGRSYPEDPDKDNLAGYSTTVHTTEVNRIIALNFILKASLIYGAIVLMVMCLTVLALQQLLDAEKNNYRFSVLRKMGVEEKDLHTLVLKQLGVWFGMPITAAIVVAIIVICYFLQSVSAEISAYIGCGALMVQVGIIIGILFLLLICYFISTWILFKRSISEN